MYNTAFHKKDISKDSFLVTGGAGFIGSNLVEYLVKYNAGKIRILDNLATGFRQNIEPFLSLPNVEFIEGDITDLKICETACKNIHYVFHEAALGSVPRSIENPIATNLVNVNGFLNMLVASRNAKVKRFVYASSSSVFGDSKVLPKVEDNIGKPLSPYAVSKLVNEQYADVFAKTYNMQIIGLRYFNIYGPNQSPNGAYAAAIPLFMEKLINNQSPFINGDGEQTRDFTFVENAVQANIKAMFTENDKALTQLFNIACGENITINQLFEIIKKYSGASVTATHREERAGDIKDSLADISKARNLLGYEPGIKTDEGLKITLEWFKKYLAVKASN
jgi:UDP-N-acetylglucosamine 4-epimerase